MKLFKIISFEKCLPHHRLSLLFYLCLVNNFEMAQQNSTNQFLCFTLFVIIYIYRFIAIFFDCFNEF